MGNLLSSGRTLHFSTEGFIAMMRGDDRAKIWQEDAKPPRATLGPLQPEWLNLVHRNHYSRCRVQKMDPNSVQQSMLRDFNLKSTKDTSGYVGEMHDYLGTREMPTHQYIATEDILDTQAYRALVTTWYENGNILDFINKRAIGDGRKLDLVKQIAQALQYLHGHGIVHGNLYPPNVLVTDDEDIVVTDAGIYTEVVKLMLSPSGRIRLPDSTLYKSRRELDGEQMPTESSDVYAFASTCYAVMTGQAPFSEIANPYERVLRVAHHDGHMALSRPSSISLTLWDLLMMCWSPDPAQRPTMNDVVGSLLSE